MLVGPLSVLMLALTIHFADEREANRLAHEICPDTHVTKVEGRFEFECDGTRFAVPCVDGVCELSPVGR